MIFYQKIFDMQLFERIRFFSKSQKIPLARLAEHIGVSPQTFNTWFAEKSQRNLWEHLQKILDLYPELSREWLYFGEGPMLRDNSIEGKSSPQAASLSESMSSSAPCTEELKRENTELTKKLLAAKDELLAAKDKIIALHEENKRLAESVSAVVTPTEARRDNPQHATSDRPASGATDCGM